MGHQTNQSRLSKYFKLIFIVAILTAGIFLFAQNEAWIEQKLSGKKPSTAVLDIPVGGPSIVPAPTPNGEPKQIPIFVYHGVIPRIESEDDELNVTPEVFRAQLQMLKDEGYETIDTVDLAEYVAGETDNLPAKPVMITFDDGRIDTITGGDPILREFNFKAVIFDVVGKQNHRDKFFLSWDDLRVAQRSGRWDIQLHAGDDYHESIAINEQGDLGYFASNKKWLPEQNRVETDEEYKERLLSDIEKGKKDLEVNLPGIKLVAFVFPFGDYGQHAMNLSQETAIAINHEVIDPLFPLSFGFNVREGGAGFFYNKNKVPHLITRLVVSNGFTAERLKANLDKFTNRSESFTISSFGEKASEGVTGIWGQVKSAPDKLILSASENATGAEAIVNGTEIWRDYRAEAEVKIVSGQTGFLLGRYQDEQNFLMCGLDGGNIALRQVVKSNNTLIKSIPFKGNRSERVRFALEVRGGQVKCSVGEQVIEGQRSASQLSLGGAGFKTWDPQVGKSQMEVYNFKMEK